jgi:hypothetical protein
MPTTSKRNTKDWGPEFEANQAALRVLYEQQERLREAAPDLLAALKAMVAIYDGVRDVLICKTVIDTLARADAAIKKAEAAQ